MTVFLSGIPIFTSIVLASNVFVGSTKPHSLSWLHLEGARAQADDEPYQPALARITQPYLLHL